jgi:hypothetical protein
MSFRRKRDSSNLSLSFRETGAISERLLQFIWQFQYFNRSSLVTCSGEELQILFQGQFNTNQGPDFSDGKIKIGKTTWAGSVELHCRASDWHRHQHGTDRNYDNVILHVVWENDGRETGKIPVLELKDRVSKLLLDRYEDLMNATDFIPCAKLIHGVADISWVGWKDRLLAERLIRKAKTVLDFLEQSNYHWEEIFWWLLARNLGAKVNAEAFEAIARSIPLKLLARHKSQIQQLEALLFGQARLLNGRFHDHYPMMLKKEYAFYKSKYKLKPISTPVFFLRMRPGNFPTVRLAQLSMLIYGSAHLFSRIREAESLSEIKSWFDIAANDYWHYHYRFGESSAFKIKNLGSEMIDNIIINTIAPVLFAYGDYHGEEKYKLKALKWLEEMPAENNAITREFVKLQVSNKTAFDSQALIELKTRYCDKRMCLDCAAGNYLLKSGN